MCEQGFNLSQSLDSLRLHEGTWRMLLDLVGTHDIPRLYRIFKNAKRHNWSTAKLLERLQQASDGSYHVRSCSDVELNLATYKLGRVPRFTPSINPYLSFPHVPPSLNNVGTSNSASQSAPSRWWTCSPTSRWCQAWAPESRNDILDGRSCEWWSVVPSTREWRDRGSMWTYRDRDIIAKYRHQFGRDTHCVVAHSRWKDTCWAGGLCCSICSERWDRLQCQTCAADADMQAGLIQGFCTHHREASTSMEDVAIRREASRSNMVDCLWWWSQMPSGSIFRWSNFLTLLVSFLGRVCAPAPVAKHKI